MISKIELIGFTASAIAGIGWIIQVSSAVSTHGDSVNLEPASLAILITSQSLWLLYSIMKRSLSLGISSALMIIVYVILTIYVLRKKFAKNAVASSQ